MAAVVTDTNLIAALILPLPYSQRAAELVQTWKITGYKVIAPVLLEYELLTSVRKSVAQGVISDERADESLKLFFESGILMIFPTPAMHRKALLWAKRINQFAAYDAQFLAVAEEYQSEFWTADRSLAAAAKQCGAKFVRSIYEDEL